MEKKVALKCKKVENEKAGKNQPVVETVLKGKGDEIEC